MRNFTLLKRLAVLPLVAVLTFTSCENKKMESSCTVSSLDIDLKNNPVRMMVPSTGKTYKLNVQVSGDATWTARSNNTNLVTVSKTDIQNTSGELLITVAPNTTYDSRSGVITISSSGLYYPIVINLTQPAAGAPIINAKLLENKDALNIKAEGDTLRYEITSEPATPLTYQIDPAASEWISTVDGKTTEWVFKENLRDTPRNAWVCVKYNSGQSAVDTIYFTQKASEIIITPAISTVDMAKTIVVKWPTNSDVLAVFKAIQVQIGSGSVSEIPVEKGMMVIKALAPATAYQVTVKAVTHSDKTSDPVVKNITTKALDDTYIFQDSKIKENLATWLFAKRHPVGKLQNTSVYLKNNGITFDTLEMVNDLILTYEFGQSANGMVDLLACTNIKNIQLGRGYYDSGIGFNKTDEFKTKFQSVATKANFPSLVKLGIYANTPATGGVKTEIKTFIQEHCTAQGFTYAADMNLILPNGPNAVGAKVTDISTLGLLDRSAWKVVAWSSNQPDEGSFAEILDGKIGTYWHSQWSAKNPYPQGFIIDMGGNVTFKQIVMGIRQGGNADSRIMKYEISFCTTPAPSSLAPTDMKLASYPQAAGVWPGTIDNGFIWSTPIVVVNDVTSNDNWFNTFTLPSAQTARCIKISVVYGENALNNSFNASEFGVSNK